MLFVHYVKKRKNKRFNKFCACCCHCWNSKSWSTWHASYKGDKSYL